MGSDWPARWRGRWIWWAVNEPAAGVFGSGPPARPADGVGFIRRRFALDAVPASARCRLTVDGRYRLWVNGTELGRGPVRSEPAYLTYDEYDLTPHLRVGANAIAVLTRHFGGPVLYWKPAPPVGALGYGSFVFEAELGEAVLASDTSWKVLVAPYARAERPAWGGPPAAEIVDQRQWPHGWEEADFDDGGWAAAAFVDPSGLAIPHPEPPSEPFGHLRPRPIPHLAERIVEPVAVSATGRARAGAGPHPLADHRGDEIADPVVSPQPLEDLAGLGAGAFVTVDFGGIVNAHPIVTVDGAPGTVVDLAVGEDLDDDGRPVIAPRQWTMRVTVDGTGTPIEALEPVGFRWLQATVRAGEARVTVKARERAFPRPPGASFSCSDPFLDELWSVGARTLDLCATDAYLDCPGREQRAWLGDAYVHTLLTFVTNPDIGLATWNLRLHGQGARNDGLLPMVGSGDLTDTATTIPDYSLHWVRTLARLWDHTGDDTLVVEQLPTAARALDWFERHRGPDGLLLDLPSWIFIDWAQNDRRERMAAVDALYALTLDDFAALCAVAGDSGSAARARARADRTREAFEAYWDAERGVYVDAIGIPFLEGAGQGQGRRVSQQVNATAILAGCAPPERWAGMLAYVFDDDSRLKVTRTPASPGAPADLRLAHQWHMPVDFDEETDVVVAQPFYAHFVHQAVVAAGERERILPLVRRWEPLVARGNNAIEEYWDAPPGEGSRCHAWSCTPTYDLTTHVLGVRAGGPGWDTVVVDPQLGDLQWAEGTVPTPRGWVHVRAEADKGAVVIDLPDGVTLVP